LFKWWQDLQKRDRAFNDAIAREKAEREGAINKLSPSERAEYEAEIQARDEKSLESIDQGFRTVLNVVRVLGIIGIIGTMLFYPPGIFALLPFFVAIWGIQLLTKK
jgi:hypothetical protein